MSDANTNKFKDPKIVIAGLRQQIDVLRAELQAAGKDSDEPAIPPAMDDLVKYVE